MKKTAIQFLFTLQCHVWKKALDELQTLLKKAKFQGTLEAIIVLSPKQAKKLKFTGSPTILINGRNIDPMRRKLKKYTFSTCTLYLWKGKSYEYPPKEMITIALNEK